MNKNGEWLLCPICNGKTRVRIREDTKLINFLLFCPKCKNEMLLDLEKFKITKLSEPDAKTQSQSST